VVAEDGGGFTLEIGQVEGGVFEGPIPFHIACDPSTESSECTATFTDAPARAMSVDGFDFTPVTIDSAGALRFALLGPEYLLPGPDGVPRYGVQDGVSQPLVRADEYIVAARASPWWLLCSDDFPSVTGVGDLSDTLCGPALDVDSDGWRVPAWEPGREPPLYGGDCHDGDDHVYPTAVYPDVAVVDHDCDGWPLERF
jgi:hypothetical protein